MDKWRDNYKLVSHRWNESMKIMIQTTKFLVIALTGDLSKQYSNSSIVNGVP